MSYMSPSYILQSQFPTKHAKRYSLLLYREEGWELDTVSRFPSRLHLPYEQSRLGASQSFLSPDMLGLPIRSVR